MQLNLSFFKMFNNTTIFKHFQSRDHKMTSLSIRSIVRRMKHPTWRSSDFEITNQIKYRTQLTAIAIIYYYYNLFKNGNSPASRGTKKHVHLQCRREFHEFLLYLVPLRIYSKYISACWPRWRPQAVVNVFIQSSHKTLYCQKRDISTSIFFDSVRVLKEYRSLQESTKNFNAAQKQ